MTENHNNITDVQSIILLEASNAICEILKKLLILSSNYWMIELLQREKNGTTK